jgi:hypothetical protein
MDLNSTLLTVDWLNRELDKIIIITDYIDTMIQETEDDSVLYFLQEKLQELEKQCVDVGNKIDFEKKQLLSLVGEKI